MAVDAPSNIQDLDTMSAPVRSYYRQLEAATARASEKHKDVDTKIYTAYLHDYIEKMQGIDDQLQTTPDKPLDRRHIESTMQKAVNQLANEFAIKYPKSESANEKAFQYLYTEMNGKSWGEYASDLVYDNEKKEIKWSTIGGALGGLLAFGWIGKYIAGAAGMDAGIMGTLAITVMAIAGAAFCGNLAHNFFNPTPAIPGGNEPSHALGQQKGLDKDGPATEQVKTRAPSTPEYVFTPNLRTGVGIVNAPNHHQKIPVAQAANGNTHIARGKADMMIEGEYIPGTNGNYRFKVLNAHIQTPNGTKMIGAGGQVFLEADKDGKIDLNSDDNRRNLNALDAAIIATNNMNRARDAARHNDPRDSYLQKKLQTYDYIDNLGILHTPDTIPAKTTDISKTTTPTLR